MSAPPQRRLTSEERRTAIRDSALTLFSQRGYLSVSIDAIATEAGVSKALIYYPEASRGQLVEIAMDFAWLGLERLSRGERLFPPE